jgi:XTP/dITP diphosphohydrolase
MPHGKHCVVVATHNRDKVREIRRVLRGMPLTVKGLDVFPPYNVRETGRTLEANALLKARAAVKRTGCASLADDTGLEVRALRGAPGVYSARFAGPGCSYADNNRKLLRVMETKRDRRGVFRCVVAAVFPDGKAFVFEGKCPGAIRREPAGANGFGYDPVFQPAGKKKTFAQMTVAEKNRVSHRGKSFLKAKQFIRRYFRRNPAAFLPKPPVSR